MAVLTVAGGRRYVVLGAGAVGGGIGGFLARAGYDVALVARGAHLAALQARGLTLMTPARTQVIAVPAVGSVGEIGWRAGDIAVLATKLMDAGALLDELVAVAATPPPVVCATNGLAAERMAARRGLEVYAMTVWTPATHLTPGEVRVHGGEPAGVLDLGRWPEGTDALAREVAADLTVAGFEAAAIEDIRRWKRAKLLTNAVGVLLALDPEPAAEAVAALMDEGRAVYRAAGLPWVPDEELMARVGHIESLPVAGRHREGGSAWQGLVRARRSEVDWLCGELIALGRELGVATPANREVQARTHRRLRELAAEG